jgi:ubiquinone/menaquinone biosynthesis C-methylase UbiE
MAIKSAECRDNIYRNSESFRSLEPVPGDFLIKKTILDILCAFLGQSPAGLGLEIGCGSGYNSALLSAGARKIIATDLPYYDARSHSLGISRARDLLAALAVKNVKVLSCSGESLPFPDGKFDFVFSLSVLEHIDNKDAALKEMFRVLKPGGVAIICVPTFFASLCSFAHLYLYTIRRIFQVAITKLLGKKAESAKTLLPVSDDVARAPDVILGSFRKSHPSFPLPEAHGSYHNIYQEISEQLPWKWTNRIRACGGTSLTTFGLLFLPYNILEVFSTRLLAVLYSRTIGLHRLMGRSFLQYCAYSWCIHAKKK